MPYRFATEDIDYSDFSAGRVMYSQPGLPAFPVRLASEIFQRAAKRLEKSASRLTVYDPTSGGAYHLTAIGFLHGERIQAVIASDVDERALALAQRNLGLLSSEGLARREVEIRQMLADYGKASHAEALRSIDTLRSLRSGQAAIATRTFRANALDPAALAGGLQGETPDLVISDVPYGQMSGWQQEAFSAANVSAIHQMLEALTGVLAAYTLVAVAADKQQKIAHPGYQRLEHFQVGKRQVVLLQRAE